MADTPIKPSEDPVAAKDTANAGLPKRLVQLIAAVRTKLRDFPELNRLVEGKETSDREIALAIAETVDDFNNTPPLIQNFGIENFPSMSLLIRGSVIHIIESVGLLQTRNQMVYSDGEGVTVNVSDKTPMLIQWLQLFSNQYEAKKQRLKKALNLQGALNGTHLSSEYRYVDGLFDEY